MSMDFAALIPVDVQRATLEADRQRFIAEGYDNQRTRERVATVSPDDPALAQLDENLRVLTVAVQQIDQQLAAFDNAPPA